MTECFEFEAEQRVVFFKMTGDTNQAREAMPWPTYFVGKTKKYELVRIRMETPLGEQRKVVARAHLRPWKGE